MEYVQQGWSVGQQAAPPTRFPLKRTRSESPISNKRRVPASYQPSIYSVIPSRITQELGDGAVHSRDGTPISLNGSTGDWVTRTEDLQLATPPGGASPLYDGEGYGFTEDGGDDAVYSQEMMDAEPIESNPQNSFSTVTNQQSYFQPQFHSAPTSLPSTPLARASPFTHQIPTPPIHPPHDPPSLYSNLAGSPVTRTDSSDSSASEIQADVRMGGTSPPQKKSGGWRVAMGYRADCDKCLQRVPGHYSHIIHD